MIKVVCWNVAKRYKPLDQLAEMDADVGLLQEVGSGMAVNLPSGMETGRREHWDSQLWSPTFVDRWPMVLKLSDRVDVEWFDQVGPDTDRADSQISLRAAGLMAVARISPKDPDDGEPFFVASAYARWYPDVGSGPSIREIIAYLSTFRERNLPDCNRVLVAGDFNIYYKSGFYNWRNWERYKRVEAKPIVETVTDEVGYIHRIYNDAGRYSATTHRPNGDLAGIDVRRWKNLHGANGAYWSIKRRINRQVESRRKLMSGEVQYAGHWWEWMKSSGFHFVGPQYPNGRRPEPTPDYLPSDTENVATFQSPGQPIEDADQQLDFVFATYGFHYRITAHALNSAEEWGPSDHCRILIEIAPYSGRS